MKTLLVGLILSLSPMTIQAHELKSALGDAIRMSTRGDSTIVEYCPDNTCEVFTLAGASASTPLQDFAFAYLFSISKYAYLERFQSQGTAPAVRAVLARYRDPCPQRSSQAAARCIVGLLARRHAIRASFVRYDEGRRNATPISLARYRHGT